MSGRVNSTNYRFLFEHVTEEQQRELTTKDYITVQAKSGKKYLVLNSYPQVVSLDRLDHLERAYTVYWLSDSPTSPTHEDLLLAKKLLLENDEDAFLRMACSYCACTFCCQELHRALHFTYEAPHFNFYEAPHA